VSEGLAGVSDEKTGTNKARELPGEAIVCDPGIRSGAPTLAGTRYTVALVSGLVRDGLDNDEIRYWYPAATDWHLDAVRAGVES
jgi:uncharacterized protein (DUF433 family)